ncbi:MAG: DUF5781 family protein [Halobacteriaceae archaeon]
MEVSVDGADPAPFLSARDVFETERDLARPVEVTVRADPDERTWAAHHDDRHVLNISRAAATSAMARELALHEYAHMARHEEGHPSHTQSTEEALFLALAGREVERGALAHCYQIANHVKDIYADDITLSVGPTSKLVSFLESELATAVADRPATFRGQRITAAPDPQITAVNAAFALALLERHDAIGDDHPIYALAHAAGEDAPGLDIEGFKRRFKHLVRDPGASEHRRALTETIRAYVDARGAGGPAAD